MNPLDFVKLAPLMNITSGNSKTIIGLIDGPVAKNHADLVGKNIRDFSGQLKQQCTQTSSAACRHGTFVAGILSSKRDSVAPAIAPDCTLLVRPIFAETIAGNRQIPSATPQELAVAIVECIKAGAQVLNLSVALAQPSSRGQQELSEALDYAVRRGAIVIAAAGNQGTLGSSVITRHPGVIPVVACNLQGQTINLSNLSRTIGMRGLSAPGEQIVSLGAEGQSLTLSGTSIATPFVTGTIALLLSEFPRATATEIKLAITQSYRARRKTVVPPLLDAWAAYQSMSNLRNS